MQRLLLFMESSFGVYNELGSIYVQKAYRMSYGTFRDLALQVRPGIVLASCKKQDSKNDLPNDPILPEFRLACALQWFAGGSVYDIMMTDGISHTDTLNSCWYVVDGVKSDRCFEIVFPDDPDLQKRIAEGFSQASTANVGCYARAIDGILIGTNKPSMKDCLDVGCSSGKIFCG